MSASIAVHMGNIGKVDFDRLSDLLFFCRQGASLSVVYHRLRRAK